LSLRGLDTLYIHNVKVTGGGSIISFKSGVTKLFIDDLWISEGANLDLKLLYNGSWDDGAWGDGLFVKKNSVNLKHALSKITVRGERHPVGVRDYNEDYWEVGIGSDFKSLPIPEPFTYGAVFSLSGLGFVAWRKRRRRSFPSAL